MFHKQFDVLLSRMARSEVAVAADLVGCNAAEIAAIESKYKIQIPSIYRRYLEIMGHKSGRLFTSDHAAAFYPYVLNLTADFRTEMRDLNPPPSFALPGDALIICCRLGEQFEFIRCNSPDESIVYYFNSWNWDIVESTESIIAWLDRWCCAAEEAIASGYYKASPNGTAP